MIKSKIMWSENTNYVMALLVYTLWLPSIISCHIFLSPVTFITLKPGSSALDQFPSPAILPTETANMRPRRTPAWTLPTPTAATGVSNHLQLQNVWVNFEFSFASGGKFFCFLWKTRPKSPTIVDFLKAATPLTAGAVLPSYWPGGLQLTARAIGSKNCQTTNIKWTI